MNSLLFVLPPDFFDGARLYSGNTMELESTEEEQQPVQVQSELDDEQPRMSKWTCGACRLKFENVDDQRAHFKSDLHRLNVKRKLAGKACLSEEEFERFVGGNMDEESGVSSISGSESESDDDEAEARSRRKFGNKKVAILLSSGSVAQIWRCVILSDKEKIEEKEEVASVTERDVISRLKIFTQPPEKVVWVVFLTLGGHFAGVVVDMKKNLVQAHQTYHRYVVRARAGGKQSSRDATGRAPKSAGASLRRYNELALLKEIKGLLESWRVYLGEASCIFVYAPSRNSQSLFGEKPLLDRNDPRIRNVPFPTKRPTYKEAKRVYGQLASLTLKTREDMISLDTKIPDTTKLPDLKPEKELVKREVVVEVSETGQLTVDSSVDNVVQSLSPLHEASMAGDVALVTELLEQGADPCVKEHRGRLPYTVAADKETRNAFRKFMASNPHLWDWHTANVPSPLTDELEAAQAAKQAEKNAKRKAKEKQRRLEKKAQQKAAEAKEKAMADAKVEEARNDVSREREMRAAAAESRMKTGALKSDSSEVCSFCATPLANKLPFYKYSYKYCTVSCVNAHRKMIETE